jgi:hypothetical protein
VSIAIRALCTAACAVRFAAYRLHLIAYRSCAPLLPRSPCLHPACPLAWQPGQAAQLAGSRPSAAKVVSKGSSCLCRVVSGK